MLKYTVEVGGMMCGMCESHVNDAVREALKVQKVSSSRSKGTTTIICEDELNEEVLKDAITGMGYEVGKITKEPYEKKGLFSFFKKK